MVVFPLLLFFFFFLDPAQRMSGFVFPQIYDFPPFFTYVKHLLSYLLAIGSHSRFYPNFNFN